MPLPPSRSSHHDQSRPGRALALRSLSSNRVVTLAALLLPAACGEDAATSPAASTIAATMSGGSAATSGGVSPVIAVPMTNAGATGGNTIGSGPADAAGGQVGTEPPGGEGAQPVDDSQARGTSSTDGPATDATGGGGVEPNSSGGPDGTDDSAQAGATTQDTAAQAGATAQDTTAQAGATAQDTTAQAGATAQDTTAQAGATAQDGTGAGGDGALDDPEPAATGTLGTGEMSGSGASDDRYANDDVQRNGQNYRFIANGWGPGFDSQSVSWNGTSFIVESMNGSQGSNYEPASYPSMFCGRYSDSTSEPCGLPAALDSLTSVRTGWLWSANGNDAEYNAAYDIWIGSDSGGGGGFGGGGTGLEGYLMVWLREPIGQQPAGSLTEEGVTDVQGLPGTWDIWTGEVNRLPITNYVKQEGQDIFELEFDVMDVIADAEARGIMLPGSTLLSVAIGFEIWNGPISNLATEDFYVDVK